MEASSGRERRHFQMVLGRAVRQRTDLFFYRAHPTFFAFFRVFSRATFISIICQEFFCREICNVLAVVRLSINNRSWQSVVSFIFLSTKKRSVPLLTESEVSRSWTRLFKDGDFTTNSFDSAENLLNELRPESPLRHRLSSELTELQKLHAERLEA